MFSTAGTTGVRGLFVYDADQFAVWIGTCLRGLACWGPGPETRLAGIGSPSPLHISNADAVLLAGKADAAPRRCPPTRRWRRMADAWGWCRSTSTGPPNARLAGVDGRSGAKLKLVRSAVSGR